MKYDQIVEKDHNSSEYTFIASQLQKAIEALNERELEVLESLKKDEVD